MTAPGVALNPPPPSLLEQALRVVDEQTAQLPAGATGGLIGVATPRGFNFAIVHRPNDRFEVKGWVGKTWSGGITGGGKVQLTW